MTCHSLGRRLNQNPALRVSLFEFDDHIWLFNIEVEEPFRCKGIGSAAIRELQAYAQSANKPIGLIPLADKGYKSALERFYLRLGFVWQKRKSVMIWRAA